MKIDDMDAIFQALAHSKRRRIIDIVGRNPGITVSEISKNFDVTRFAIMKHLTVLQGAGLLMTEKEGRQRKLYFNAVPIQMIYDRWTDDYSGYWAGMVTSIKYAAEQETREGKKNER